MSQRRIVELKKDIRKIRKLKDDSTSKKEYKAYDNLEYIVTCWLETEELNEVYV